MINMNAAMERPSNKLLNVLLATGGMGVLFTGLAVVDPRVRDQFAQIVSGRGPSGEVGTAVVHVQRFIEVAFVAMRDQSLAYAPLTIFGLAAIVLFLFMKRT